MECRQIVRPGGEARLQLDQGTIQEAGEVTAQVEAIGEKSLHIKSSGLSDLRHVRFDQVGATYAAALSATVLGG
jgi:hypothetical protein